MSMEKVQNFSSSVHLSAASIEGHIEQRWFFHNPAVWAQL